jgi:predicted HAD superfamily phosphohydrolase
MNAEDIVRMAREAGLCDEEGMDSDSIVITDYLERFAKLVAAAEREACAKHFDGSDYMMYRSEVAAAIRERGAP